MKILKYLYAITLLSIITSCMNDDDFDSNENNTEIQTTNVLAQNFGASIQRDFIGKISDINGQPLSNVTVTIGTESTTTDDNGVFLFRDAQVFERFGYIKVQKAGFIDASRSIVPTEGTNQIAITMLPKSTTATTQSGTVETISLSNGAAVALQGEYVKENGESYNGTVKVTLHHLDAAAEETQNQMPGMLYAQNSEGQEQGLQTLGMLAVELTGSNGEDLNLAAGSTTEITVPVSQSLLSTAPQTIPLWYFNEAFGYWIEEGEATLEGNSYVGTVSHFSFWNCDIPFDAINLCLNLTDTNFSPLSGITVELTSQQFGSSYGITDEDGQVCGLVPIDQTFQLKLFSYLCNEITLYTTDIGPFSNDNSINLSANLSQEIISETVIGNILNCDNEPISFGYINLTHQAGNRIMQIDNGDFQINLLRCDSNSDSFSYFGVDSNVGKFSETFYSTFTTPVTNLEIFQACESSADEYYYVRHGTDYPLIFESDLNYFTLPPDKFGLSAKTFNGGVQQVFIKLPTTETRKYNSNEDGVSLSFRNINRYAFSTEEYEHDITIEVKFGEIDECIEIEFTGTYFDDNNETQYVSGFFRKRRPY